MSSVLRHIRRAALLHARDGPTDAQLVESFLTRRDETAFEALLRRHGPMVLGVCNRVLRHAQDAEDAFQATFLVLVRKAASLQSRELLGNWLYGVAQRTAMKARAMSVKRRARERGAGEMPRQAAPADETSEELLSQLDAVLSRLPDKYRVPIVLCELEGKSRKDVAQLLGLPVGTLSWRLAQAKKLLAKRLSRFGAGALAAALSQETVSARVPPVLLHATAKAALRVLAGQVLRAGVISTQVITLTEGVIKAMLLSKLKVFGVVALAACLTTAVGLHYRAVAVEPRQGGSTTLAARVAADELEELRLEIAALRRGLHSTRERVQALESEVQRLKGRKAASAGGGGGSGGSTGEGAALGVRLPGENLGTTPERRMLNTTGLIVPINGAQKVQMTTRRPIVEAATPRPDVARVQSVANDPTSVLITGLVAGVTQVTLIDDKGNREQFDLRTRLPDTGVPPEAGSGPRGAQGVAEGSSDSRNQPRALTPKAVNDPLAQAEAALKKLRANPSDTQAADALERALSRLKERQKRQGIHNDPEALANPLKQ